MMQKEFEELTGVIVSNSEYASIEREYMSCEDEKRIFCKKWVKNGGAAMLAKNRLAEIERLNAQVLALKNEASALREKLDKVQKWNPFSKTSTLLATQWIFGAEKMTVSMSLMA